MSIEAIRSFQKSTDRRHCSRHGFDADPFCGTEVWRACCWGGVCKKYSLREFGSRPPALTIIVVSHRGDSGAMGLPSWWRQAVVGAGSATQLVQCIATPKGKPSSAQCCCISRSKRDVICCVRFVSASGQAVRYVRDQTHIVQATSCRQLPLVPGLSMVLMVLMCVLPGFLKVALCCLQWWPTTWQSGGGASSRRARPTGRQAYVQFDRQINNQSCC